MQNRSSKEMKKGLQVPEVWHAGGTSGDGLWGVLHILAPPTHLSFLLPFTLSLSHTTQSLVCTPPPAP